MAYSVDLAYFYRPGDIVPDWHLGQKRAIGEPLKHTKFTIDCLLEQTTSAWVLFWDYSLGNPDVNLIEELVASNVDAWHGGLKVGTGGSPEILNYVVPSWIYTIDAGIDVTHTNFRLSLRACLIRTSVLRQLGGISSIYQSLEMSGISLGYELLRKGGVVRYHTDFVKSNSNEKINISERDEWVFLNRFFPKRWQLWTVINKKGLFRNFKNWIKVRRVKYISCKPEIHSSVKTNVTVSYKSVSVLAPTLDRYSYLLNEFEELAEQTIKPLEVLATDQTNEENRVVIDTDKYPNINAKIFPQNEKGQCVAWNKLLDEAKGEYVLFLGDDADGIKQDFIEKLLQTAQFFNCDMVASNVYECGGGEPNVNSHYYLTDTFPITLIKRDLVNSVGNMDMFYNRNIRADFDLSIRCHLRGAFMIFDPSALIGHHRAPMGGLRAHKARVVTNHMSKNMLTKIADPTSSELFLIKKYFTPLQFKMYVRVKYFNQMIVNGNVVKKILRLIVMFVKSPIIYKTYRMRLQEALTELNKRSDRA